MIRIWNKIKCLAISGCFLAACSQEEGLSGTPLYEESNVPVAFDITEGWKTRAVTDPSTTSFVNGDKFGLWGFYLKDGNEGAINGLAPNFMYHQQVAYNGSVWSYTPIKYWSNNTSDKFRFCGYAPYEHRTIAISTSPKKGLPTLTYTMPDDKKAGKEDLLYTDITTNNKLAVNEKLVLPFKHLLGKIQFNVSIDPPTSGSNMNDDNKESKLYRALIQAVKFKVNTKGSFSYAYDSDGYPQWTILNTEKKDFLELTVDPAGELINSSVGRLVHDFTAFLLPIKIETIAITVNNMTTEYDISNKNVEIIAGKVTTLNVVIGSVANGWDDARFYATFSRWEEGGEIKGDLQ